MTQQSQNQGGERKQSGHTPTETAKLISAFIYKAGKVKASCAFDANGNVIDFAQWTQNALDSCPELQTLREKAAKWDAQKHLEKHGHKPIQTP